MAANFNWNQSVNSADPGLAWSNFDVRHRIVSSIGYTRPVGKRHQSSVSLVYTGRSGFPFSYTVAGDMNNDGSSRNDLFFVPATQSDIVLNDIVDGNGDVLVSAETQWQQLDAYIANDPYLDSKRGDYTERNGGRAPWNHLLDLRLAHEIKLSDKPAGDRLEITLDIINFLNLLHHDWGHQTYVPNVLNSSYQLIDFDGVVDNRPTYQFNNPQGTPWQVDPLNSRWQAQFGVRYNF